MKINKRKFHVISNTHWDREWRYPFQRNRQMLVDMIDSVIEILQSNNDYRAYHLDSQSIVIKDYLEVKPHMRETIKQFLKNERLFIGPWYVLPEEFQVGGENLIRNLLLGHKHASEYGKVSKIGYSPFSWGQISQLPQIYNGFGINLIMFYRGINSLDSPKAEFLWIGADGTKSVSTRFSTMPRYNFYFYIYRPAVHNQGFYDVEHNIYNDSVLFHFASGGLQDEDYFIITPSDKYYPEEIKTNVNAIIKDQVNDFTTENVIWMEGHDSSGPNKKTVDIIKDIKKQFPDLNVVHSTLDDYAEEVIQSIDIRKLKKVYGERRSSQFDRRSGNLYGYTTSARMFLKQKNFEAEKWINHYAEPFNIFSSIYGREIKDQYPEMAWELIIQNSAHDSIGGCSLDEVHEDMMFRYKHSIEISKGIFERSIKHIVSSVDHNLFKNNSPLFITFINPNNCESKEVLRTFIDIPSKLDKNNFDIVDSSGKKLLYNIIKKEQKEPVLEQMTNRPMYISVNRYECEVLLNGIPGYGYKSFQIITVPSVKVKQKTIGNLSSKLPYLKNEYLKVTVNKNGTFNIYSLENKLEYKDLGYFESEGEAGHAWVHIQEHPIIDTLNSSPKIKFIHNSPLSGTILVKYKITVPSNLTERKKKNAKRTVLVISLNITLNKESNRVDLNCEVNNSAESHRMRIMFPTDIKGADSYGEGQFDVVKRSSKRINSKGWIEEPMYDYPMHHFVDISNDQKGLAVIVKGLKEYELLDDKRKTVAITLFRGFEYIIAPSSKQDYTWQKGSQCLGIQKAEMALYPHKFNWEKGGVYKEALKYNYSPVAAQSGRAVGNKPVSSSFIKIDAEGLILGAIKKPETEEKNAFILRLYNPTDKKITGGISFLNNVLKAALVTLEEEPVKELRVIKRRAIKISVLPKKIITIKVYKEESKINEK